MTRLRQWWCGLWGHDMGFVRRTATGTSTAAGTAARSGSSPSGIGRRHDPRPRLPLLVAVVVRRLRARLARLAMQDLRHGAVLSLSFLGLHLGHDRPHRARRHVLAAPERRRRKAVPDFG